MAGAPWSKKRRRPYGKKNTKLSGTRGKGGKQEKRGLIKINTNRERIKLNGRGKGDARRSTTQVPGLTPQISRKRKKEIGREVEQKPKSSNDDGRKEMLKNKVTAQGGSPIPGRKRVV